MTQQKPKTHVILLLDRSGSMQSIREQAVVWYNEWVQQFKENAKTQEIAVSLITFNADVFEHMWRQPVEKLSEASLDSYNPNGGTSLRDAMGYAIDKAMAEDDKEWSYLFVCITDGDDTTSSKYSRTLIREIFQGIEGNNRWTHNLVGCEKDSIFKELQEMTGLGVGNMAKVAYNNVAGGVVRSRKSTGKYFAARAAGASSVCNFTGQDTLADYSAASVNDADMDADDIACFKRISIPLASNATGQDTFAANTQNCVVSSNRDYHRPTWNATT